MDLLIDSYGLREKIDELNITTGWDEAVGPMIARHTKSVRLRKGRLNVKVDSAPLRHELTFMRETLIEILNRRAGRKVVE